MKTYILTLSCRDVRGIVAAVSGFLAANNGFIIESGQFGDASTERFFMRVEFSIDNENPSESKFKQLFSEQIASRFQMDWYLHDKSIRHRVMIMVSKYGHCLNDLLYRYTTKLLPFEIPLIVSNHLDFKDVIEWHGIPFHHLPVSSENRKQQEEAIFELSVANRIDVVVLARYMQILSPELCLKLSGKAINIHHSFLPGFKGAKPYHQAFSHGVKLIGATAHYVTAELDDGPIIEQDVIRVDHTYKPEDLEAVGRESECSVLARALKYHIEQRVLVNGNKTVVFK